MSAKIPKKRYLVIEDRSDTLIAYENERGDVNIIAEKRGHYVSMSAEEMVRYANMGLAAERASEAAT